MSILNSLFCAAVGKDNFDQGSDNESDIENAQYENGEGVGIEAAYAPQSAGLRLVKKKRHHNNHRHKPPRHPPPPLEYFLIHFI